MKEGNIKILVYLMLLFGFILANSQISIVVEARERIEDLKSLRHLVPERWWEKAAGVKILTLKKGPKYSYAHPISIDPKKAERQLDKIKEEGFQAIEIFAPAEGLYAYNGLDTKNHFRIDPDIGTMDDFGRVVRIAHSKNLAVIVFYNLGYFSIEAPDWIEACKDRNGEKAKWFWWADKRDTPSPPESIYFNLPKKGWEKVKETWGWQYSNLAGCYYWSRWMTKNKDGNYVGLPQNNWASEEWPKEAERIVHFWMDSGIDGMIIDAPIFYAGCTWRKNNEHITDVISSYGNTMIQPEGARSVAWIIKGGYNCMQDYGLYQWDDKWRFGKNSIMDALETGDPRPIEESLCGYHDIIAAAGGILYQIVQGLHSFDDSSKRHLERATVAAIGDLVVYNRTASSPDIEETWILKTKQSHPALQQLSARRKLRTNADSKYYAFLRTAKDKSESILIVLNFQNTSQTVKVDLSGIPRIGLVELKNRELIIPQDTFEVELPAYGYRFYQVLMAKE